MNSEENNERSDCGVNHKSTALEVERFAFEHSHIVLHAAIQLQRKDSEVSWEQCMQYAAIEQAKIIKDLERQLSQLLSRTSRLCSLHSFRGEL